MTFEEVMILSNAGVDLVLETKQVLMPAGKLVEAKKAVDGNYGTTTTKNLDGTKGFEFKYDPNGWVKENKKW